MNLDEAIQSFKDEMEKQTALGHPEHIDNLEQMSDWLRELKAYKEQSGDAISRQAVMDCFKKWQPYMATRLWDFEQELSALPSVTPQHSDAEIQKIQEMEQAEIQKAYELGKAEQPQQRTGRWILLDECLNSGYYCSECQKKVVKEGWSNTVKKIKYCPNCGAKMEVDE